MSANVCLGIDISKWQWGKPVPWGPLRERDVLFSVSKCTQNRYVDPFFKRAHYEAGEEGFVRGAYTWFMPDADPSAAADFFVDTVKDFKDIIIWVDFEEPKTMLRGRALVDRCEQFCQRIEELTGKFIRLYTGVWYWVGYAENVDSPYLASRSLCHAQYPRIGVDPLDYQAALTKLAGFVPSLPMPWLSRKLRELFFQFDGDKGLVLPNGVDSDFNIFRGSSDDLVACAAETIQPTEPPYRGEILDARSFNQRDVVVDVLDAIAAGNDAFRMLSSTMQENRAVANLGARIASDSKLIEALSNSA